MKDFGPGEAYRSAPAIEIGTGEVECVPELDQHVERHQQAERVLAPRVVDDVLHDCERSARRKRVIRCFYEMHLLLEIPIVKDHSHRHDVGLRERLGKEIQGPRSHPISDTRRRDLLLRNLGCNREINGHVLHVWICFATRIDSSPLAPPTSQSVL